MFQKHFIFGLTQSSLRILLISIFISIFIYTFFDEIILVRNGLGYDGYKYYDIVVGGIDYIIDKKINGYHFFRIFPFILFDILSLPKDIPNVIFIIKCINFLSIVLSILFYFKTCKFLKLKEQTGNIGFVLLFFTFPILKLVNYNPLLTDHISFALAIIGLYYTLTDNSKGIGVILFIALFNFPSLVFYIVLINLFTNREAFISIKIQWKYFKVLLTLFIVILTILGYYFYYIIIHKHPSPIDSGNPVNLNLIKMSSGLLILYFWFIMFILLRIKEFKISLNFSSYYFLILIILILFLIYITKTFLPLRPVSSENIDIFSSYAIKALNMPLNFIVYHLFYFGFIFILIFAYIKEILEYSIKFSVGYFILIIFTYLFLIQNESRILINLIPFILILILKSIDHKNFTINQVFYLLIIGILQSRFYVKINGNPETFNSLQNPKEFKFFPAQTYFMNFGPWVSYQSYKLELLVFVFFIIMYFIVFEKFSDFKTRILSGTKNI
jgi:hypothetical protein